MDKKKIDEEEINNENEQFTDEEEILFEEELYEIDINNKVEKNENFDLIFKFNTNKHREEGKHSLERDTIFKGKLKKQVVDENDNLIENSIGYTEEIEDHNDNFSILDNYKDNEDYLNQNNLSKDIYNMLKLKTDIDFSTNRRKPNREIFNMYYDTLLKELGFRYTKSEIFVELSFYFTDNIFNMFKLLDKRPATIIIKELIQKGYLKNLNGINFL
jgi:hypothetical protein